MKKIINSGIYDIDLEGSNADEFIGNHPTLILRSIKNEEMYYAFPLTTYTLERWKKYKKNYCCRILTTNSIVRIDKVQIIHSSKIMNYLKKYNRWIKNDQFLIPTPAEIRMVYERYKEYLKLTTDKAIKEYEKYYDCYNNLINALNKQLNHHIEQDGIKINRNENVVCIDLKYATNLTFDDVKHIIFSIFGKQNVKVSYSMEEAVIIIEISKAELLLTLENIYDNMNLTKGNDNKTSVKLC